MCIKKHNRKTHSLKIEQIQVYSVFKHFEYLEQYMKSTIDEGRNKDDTNRYSIDDGRERAT